MQARIKEIIDSPSVLDEIKASFITEDIKKIDDSYIKFLYHNVNRGQTIGKFTSILKDINKSIAIEIGIFEFTLVYAASKNYALSLFAPIYYDKVCEIELNLKDDNYLGNKTLKNALEKNIDPRALAFLRPQDMHPENWSSLIRKANIRDDKKNNMATSDLYVCDECGGKNCRVVELQLRSADEPTTKIKTCMSCMSVSTYE